MFNKKDLSNLTISDLKKIADEIKVNYSKNIKKEDLVNLILQAEKMKELTEEKKSDLNNNPHSQTSFQYYESKNIKNEYIPTNSEEDLPKVYGKNKIVLMVRDPYWGFAYWDLSEDLIKEHNLFNVKKFLRVYDITNSNNIDKPDSFFDIQINNEANNWYIKFQNANRTYFVDYGYIENGNFKTLLRSNVIKTPRDNVSDQIDEEWMLTDDKFRLILKASGADQLFEQIGSQELIKFLAGNVSDNVSSNSSPTSPFGPF